jgi:hypothetical protein
MQRLAAVAFCWCGLLPGQLVWVWVRLVLGLGLLVWGRVMGG